MSKPERPYKSLIALGFCVAFLSGGLGIGGGAIFVSVLASVLHFDFRSARSLSLAMIMPITLVGFITHACCRPDMFSFWYYLFIPSCVLGSLIGGRYVCHRDISRIKGFLGLFLLIASLKMTRIIDLPLITYGYLDSFVGAYAFPAVMMFAFFTGIVSVLLGVGCGLLMVPFFICVLHLDMHESICLSLATMFCMSATATFYHKKCNALDLSVVKVMILPVLTGVILGALLANNLPSHILKTGFGLFLFVFSCKILMNEFMPRKVHDGFK